MDPHPLRASLAIALSVCLSACASQPKRPQAVGITSAELRRYPTPSWVKVTPAPPVDTAAPIGKWRDRYPQAARMLDAWSVRYPEAALAVRHWTVEEPQQFEVLTMWAASSQTESLETFLMGRERRWHTLVALRHQHPMAMDELVDWLKTANPAAEELAMHPGGFAVVTSDRWQGALAR